MSKYSLGLIESKCFTGMVEALDIMAKAVNIRYALHQYAGLGLSAVAIYGSTADVKEAVEIAKNRLNAMGFLYTVTYFSNPHDELIARFFRDSGKSFEENPNRDKKISKDDNNKKTRNIQSKKDTSDNNDKKAENSGLKNKSEESLNSKSDDADDKKKPAQLELNTVAKNEKVPKRPRNCNFICSLCPEKDCPDRWT